MRDSSKAAILAAILFVVSYPGPAWAQGIGYGVAGVGGVTGWFGGGPAYQVAGGGELLFRKTAGVGGEVGLFGNSGSALWLTSANGVVHLPIGSEASPFVTGGYSRLSSGEGVFHAWNVGAGADIWAAQHVGVRVEARDHIRRDFRGTVHYFIIRAGIALK